MTGIDGQAGPLVTTDSPLGFFTNVATRLLQSQLGLSLNHLQLYPTNQYTPSVHRFLQVTANLYDAMTNRTITGYPYLPSVFRPLFTNDSGAICITGYAEVTDTSVLNATMRDLQLAGDRAALQPTDMVYGVPVVIGAKKGFPNFNELAMQTQVQVVRKLQFLRPDGTDHRQPLAGQSDQPDVCCRHFQRVRRRGLEFLRLEFLPQPANHRDPRRERRPHQRRQPPARSTCATSPR